MSIEEGPAARLLRGELRDFLHRHEQRRRQLPRAILLGVLVGVVATGFRAALLDGEALRERLTAWAVASGGVALLAPVAVGALGAAFAVALLVVLAPEAGGSGIPHLKAVLHRLQPLRWARVLAVKFVGGAVGIATGLTLGREGPTIQMGGALGQMVSGWFGSTPRERQTLIAAGAGAGLAAAFNAPLAGLVFVLEELQGNFAPAVFTVTLVASVVADVMARLLFGQLPVFHVALHAPPPLTMLPAALLLGGASGLLGVLFNRGLVAGLDLADRGAGVPRWLPAAGVGAAIGLIGLWWPALIGSGHTLLDETLAGSLPMTTLLLCFVLRFGLTMASYATGAPGGIFAPLLLLGAQLGLTVALLMQHVLPDAADQRTTYAVLGMAAYFTAIVRAPLTGIVLLVEMTGDYALVLPLLVACLAAYGLADFLGDRPIYEALLERDLLRTQPAAAIDRPLLLEVTIAPGSPFDGRPVSELGLPPGCVLVAVGRGGREEIPTGTFVLRADDRVTAVVDPTAATAAALLHDGARGHVVAG